jgi:lipid A 3-O-deacylase
MKIHRCLLLLIVLNGSSFATGVEARTDVQFGGYVTHLRQNIAYWGAYADFRWQPNRLPVMALLTLEAEERGAAYLGVGISGDLSLTERWALTASLTGGPYRNGKGFDLGANLQFRTGLELAYQPNFAVNWKGEIVLGFFHHSNGSLQEFNPGKESLRLGWRHPF